jgi:cytoskeleton protein RodZ
LTEAVATGVGAELAQARETQGLALVDIAQQLKFSPRQLEALEQERFGALPGPTIARGMLRNYARLLKLDADALLARLGDRLDAPDSGKLAARFSQPVPFSDNARRSTLVYAGVSILILGAVGTVAYEWHQESNAKRQLAFVAAAKAPLEPVRAAPAPAPSPSAPEADPPPSALEADAPSSAPKAALPPSAPKTAASTAKTSEKIVEAAPAVEARVVPAKPPAAGVHRIVVRCEQECWIEVKDGLERQLVSSLNPAGTERVLRGQPPFELVIGNAQHVRVTYNDRPIDLQPHTRVEVARFKLR